MVGCTIVSFNRVSYLRADPRNMPLARAVNIFIAIIILCPVVNT